MAKTFTVVRARQNFATLVAAAERGGVIEITRRGRPVAIVLSAAQYAALSRGRSFSTDVAELRERLRVERLSIDDRTFSGLRDRAPDRDVRL